MSHSIIRRLAAPLALAASLGAWPVPQLTAQCSMDTTGYQYRVVAGHFTNHNTSPNHQNDMAMMRPTGASTAAIDVLGGSGFDEYKVSQYWSGALDAASVTNRMVVGDFDADGERDDIAALHDLGAGGTTILVWIRSSPGAFEDPDSFWTSGGYTSTQTTGRVVSGDFDDDGRIDDIAAFYDYGSGQTRIHVWLGTGTALVYQGDAGWWSTTGYTADRVTNRVVSGDFDRDGNLDDIAAFYDYTGGQTRIHVWLRNGSLALEYQGAAGWWSTTGYTAGQVTGRVVAGDFDRDGKYDDITAFYDYGPGAIRAHVWRSTGSSFSYSDANGYWKVTSGYTAAALTGRIGCVSINQGFLSGYKFSTILGVYDYGPNTSKFHRWKTVVTSHKVTSSWNWWPFGSAVKNNSKAHFAYTHESLCP